MRPCMKRTDKDRLHGAPFGFEVTVRGVPVRYRMAEITVETHLGNPAGQLDGVRQASWVMVARWVSI